MEEINKKLDKLCKRIEEIEKNLLKKYDDIEKSLGKKYDELERSMVKRYEEIKNNLKTTIDTIQQENKILREEIIDLKERTETFERISLETTLNLYPVIEAENFDLSSLIQKIGAKIGVKIDGSDILNQFRRKTKKSGKPGDIVIKFATKELRDKVLDGIKKTKLSHEDIGIKCNLKRIYGNEELTKNGKDIFYKALRYKYEENIKFLWIKAGKTYLKKDEGSNAIRLDSMEVINKLYQK